MKSFDNLGNASPKSDRFINTDIFSPYKCIFIIHLSCNDLWTQQIQNVFYNTGPNAKHVSTF